MTDQDILDPEDKYGRFYRDYDIDIKTIEEAALGDGNGGTIDLSSYYTKAQTDDLLSDKEDTVDLSGTYYNKTQVDSALSQKADATALGNYLPTSQKGAAAGLATLDNNSTVPVNQIPTMPASKVGLANVNNTADVDKPVSTAVQDALNSKYTLPEGGIPSTDLNASVQRTLATYAAQTKTATLCFGSPNSANNGGNPAAIGNNQINCRVMNMVHVAPVQYRFRISNANAQNGNNPGASVVLNSIWIGQPLYNGPNKKWNGDMSGTPVRVYNNNDTLPATGTTDLVTPWITNAGELSAYKPFVMSYGASATSGSIQLSDAFGQTQYGATSASQAGIAIPASGYNYAGVFFDIRLEYQFNAASNDLIALVIGASGEAGYTEGDQSANPRALSDPPASWPGTWSSRQGYHVINAGLSGSATTDWLLLSTRPYGRFDLTTTVPDIAIIGSMASNDIANGTTLDTVINNYETLIDNMRSLGIMRIFGVTIPPRSLPTDEETVRTQFNSYIRAIPYGLEDIFDFDLLLRDPTNRSVIYSDLVSSDSVHPDSGGYKVLASGVTISPKK